MELKNVKVWDSTKDVLKVLKATLRFKSEAELISYLVSVYNDNWHKLSLEQDRNYRRQVEHEKNDFNPNLAEKWAKEDAKNE